MSLLIFLLPFAVAAVLVPLIAFFLRFNKGIAQEDIAVGANVCNNLAITSVLVDKVNNINSVSNDVFRSDKSMSCFDFLYTEDINTDSERCENTILNSLDGKI